MSDHLKEGLDYYLENGLMVFTGHFLQQRGYCCKSGCRHCPYGIMKSESSGNSMEFTEMKKAPLDFYLPDTQCADDAQTS